MVSPRRLAMKPGSSWARMGVLPISWTIRDAFSIVSGDVDVPRMISTSFVTWAGLKKCIPIALSLLEIFWEILSRLNVDVFEAIIAAGDAADSITKFEFLQASSSLGLVLILARALLACSVVSFPFETDA